MLCNVPSWPFSPISLLPKPLLSVLSQKPGDQMTLQKLQRIEVEQCVYIDLMRHTVYPLC